MVICRWRRLLCYQGLISTWLNHWTHYGEMGRILQKSVSHSWVSLSNSFQLPIIYLVSYSPIVLSQTIIGESCSDKFMTVIYISESTWGLPSIDKRHGMITRYDITHRRVLQANVTHGSSEYSQYVDTPSLHVSSLTAGSVYEFTTIIACTSAGFSSTKISQCPQL